MNPSTDATEWNDPRQPSVRAAANGNGPAKTPPAAEVQPSATAQGVTESTFVSPKGHKYRVIHTCEVDDYQKPAASPPRRDDPPPP